MPAPLTDQDHKLRARRRLIGAVALTIIAVIFLPLVLEDEPPPAGPLEVHMPPPPAQPAAESTVEYAPPPANTTVEPPAAEEAAAPATPPEPEAVESVAAQPKPAAPKPVSPKPEAVKPVPAKHVAATPQAKPVAPDDKPTQAQASATYTIQVGVFSDSANVQKIQSRISAMGLKSYTEQVMNGTRVRVGSFSSRAEAEAVAGKLAAGGVTGSKVVEK